MGGFRWLHFSDLHLTPEADFDTHFARNQLIKFLSAGTVSGHLQWDYIFFTGDIANKGKYDGVKDFINKLFCSLNLRDTRRVFWSVGNHDISRESKLRSLIIENIRDVEKRSVQFESCMDDPEIREFLLDRGMNDYYERHKEILNKEAFINNPSSPHAKHVLPDLNLIVLNTCITSCDDNDEHKLHINECGLNTAFEGLNPNNPVFVIGHHGREYFKNIEQKKFGYFLNSSGVDLYLCGHSHTLGHACIDDAGRDIHQISCGGGIVDEDPTKFSFIHGSYNSTKHSVVIKPYSYEGNGNKEWHFDQHLHLRLDGVTELALTGNKDKTLAAKMSPTNGVDTIIRNELVHNTQVEWLSGFFRFDDRQMRGRI